MKSVSSSTVCVAAAAAAAAATLSTTRGRLARYAVFHETKVLAEVGWVGMGGGATRCLARA